MATWDEVTREAPELADAVRRRFDAHIHKTLATLRADGSPRITGVEASFRGGQLWLGMMPDSRKARDLQRDPRFALHSAPVDPELTEGDARISGRAVEITDPETFSWFVGTEREEKGQEPPQPFHLFRADVQELVLVRVAGEPPDHLVIDSWREGRGGSSVERR